MKFATVYTRDGKRPLIEDGKQKIFPTFRWYSLDRSETGWTLHLLAFCVATTEDFKFQMYEGLCAFGWHSGPYIGFSPGVVTYRIHVSLKEVIHVISRRLL